jgi:multiple sugar transport system permease protein
VHSVEAPRVLTVRESRRRRKARERLVAGALHVVLLAGAATMLIPLLWMLSTSLKEPGAVFTFPPQWLPTTQVTAEVGGRSLKVFVAEAEGRRFEVGLVRYVKDGALVTVLDPEHPKHGQTIEVPSRVTTGTETVDTLSPLRRFGLPFLPVKAEIGGQWLPLYRSISPDTEPIVAVVSRTDHLARVVGYDPKTGVAGPPVWVATQLTRERSRPALLPKRRLAIRWQNYPEAWSKIRVDARLLGLVRIRNAFTLFYLNSIYVAVLVTLAQVFTSSLAAYAFARLRFRGRDTLFLAYLGTLMVPGVVTMIPVFILLKNLALIDTYTALILPASFSAYGTFLLRQFFLSIPVELEDAAKIDGCGKWGVYWNVIMPLSKPALATLTTFTFLGNWNSFMWPLIVINSIEKKTLPVGLEAFRGLYQTEWTLLMAASMIAIVPVLLVFVFNQRFFVRGILLGGVKG